MTRYRYWLLVLLPMILGAKCDGIITNGPLADPLTAAPDESLYGHWIETTKADGKTKETHLFIGRHDVKDNPDGIMESISVNYEKDEKKVGGSSEKMLFSVARVGQEGFLSLLTTELQEKISDTPGSYGVWAKSDKKVCVIARYKCDGMTFQLWTASKDMTKKLIQNGDLKESSKGVVAIDSLARYLRKNGGENLFTESVSVYTKSK